MQFFSQMNFFAYQTLGLPLALLLIVLVFHSRQTVVNKVMPLTGIGTLFIYTFVVHIIKAYTLFSIK